MPHQQRFGRAAVSGLTRRGYSAFLTSNKLADADIHVCIGPWFALEHWRNARTLYFDRAYWGDPDCVSVHWLRNGEKHFTRNDEKRLTPVLSPMRGSERSIYLCDYRQKPDRDTDAVRRHPSDGETGSLVAALDGYGVAVGRRTTALVDAAILGLRIETSDPHSPVWPLTRGVDRGTWINRLAWHNWSAREIETGEFLDAIGDY